MAVSISANPTVLVEEEGTVLTITLTSSEPIPEGGLVVTVDSETENALAQLDVFATEFENLRLVGVNDDTSGFSIRLNEQTGTLSLPIFDDDVADAIEGLTFTLQPGEGYTVDQSASSISLTLLDAETATPEPPPDVPEVPVDPIPSENTPPVAQSDSYTVEAGEELSVDVDAGILANDSDAEGNQLIVSVLDTPDSGNLSLNEDGSFSYTPNDGFSGTDTFTYLINDGEIFSEPATVEITVEAGTPTEGGEGGEGGEAGTPTEGGEGGEGGEAGTPTEGGEGGEGGEAGTPTEGGEGGEGGEAGTPTEGGEGGEAGTASEGYQPGDSFDLVTPAPTYEGELTLGEQANADFVDKLEGEELLDELQDGGNVIYFRHAQTEKDFADQVTADVTDFSTQRVLSEFGVQQSLAIGEGFDLSQIPYDDVITSEYGRAINTAAIAFGEYEKDPALNFLPFEDYTDEQVEEMRANVLPLLTAEPEAGTNSIIVGHDDIFEAGTGIYPAPQGIAYVLDPDGNGDFEIIANLLPEEWVQLSEGGEGGEGGESGTAEEPTVSFSTIPTTINEAEGTALVMNFSVEGEIPEAGITVDLEGDAAGIMQQFTVAQTRFDSETGSIFYRFDNAFADNTNGNIVGGTLNRFSLEDGDPSETASNEAAAGTGFLSDFSFTITEADASITIPVLDDIIEEADTTYTYTLVDGDGYTVNPEANSDTFTVTDGVPGEVGPTVEISATTDTLFESEQTPITINLTTQGEIPAEGLVVFIEGSPRAIAEFDVNATNPRLPEDETEVTGPVIEGGSIVGTDETAGGFFFRVTEENSSITVPVFQDDVAEGLETLTFTLRDGELYEVGANASSITVNIEDERPTTPEPTPEPTLTTTPEFGTINADIIEVEGSGQIVFGGSESDLIDASIGSEGGNRIYAGSGDDTLILGMSDRIIGGAGDDKFFAMSGGDNIITGGEGADQFWIATAEIPEAANIITDFTSGEDVLGIAGLGIGFDDLSITGQDDNTLVAANNSELAILQGISADSLIADNFAFA